MSHIQKVLERAEREGSIRPAAVLPAAPTMFVGPADATIVAPAPALSDSRFVGVEAAPLVTIDEEPRAIMPARVVTPRLDRRLQKGLAPGSTTAEQYRSIRTRIMSAANGHAPHSVLVTSAQRGDGKTQTAAGLGLTMAQERERRICLVDADLRKPQLHGRLGLPSGPGLSDVLNGTATLEDVLVTINDYNMTLLPGGTAADPELLGTNAMRRVLQALRAQFDRVVIDAPSATSSADIAVLSPLVEGVLLVVRVGVTPKPAIHDAIAVLDADRLLGFVLNGAH
jgi:capsular exopolysaccharide synthesis family protein